VGGNSQSSVLLKRTALVAGALTAVVPIVPAAGCFPDHVLGKRLGAVSAEGQSWPDRPTLKIH
jgi:hypothetical protein